MSSTKEQAIGFIETLGMGPAIIGADSMLKAANVELFAYENVGSTLVTIMVSGDVSAVKASVEAGVSAAKSIGKVTACNVIPRPARIVRRIANEYAMEDIAPKRPHALALVETFGLVALLEAADAMGKAADVKIVGFENVASGYISVLAQGDVAACQSAVAAGVSAVENLGSQVHCSLIIPTPHVDLLKIIDRYRIS